jgi:uncharacterized membrane protein HdeD (DUF308 family)
MFSINQLIRNRGSLILKGTAMIVFGLVAFTHPGEAILRMMLPFGLLVLLNGIIGICRSISFFNARLPVNRLLMTKGIAESIIGLSGILFLNTSVTFFLVLISLWLMLTGFVQLKRSQALKPLSSCKILSTLSGITGIFFGCLLLVNLRFEWFAPRYEIASFSLVMGSIMIYTYIRIRELRHYLDHHPKKSGSYKNTVYYDRAY